MEFQPAPQHLHDDPIVGIDLGTTNSVVAIFRDGKPVVLPVEDGRKLLPSAVGIDHQGNIIVGTPARNQAILAPERTILSVKRKMGLDVRLTLGDQQLTPQEVSAIILRTLKERAEQALGQSLRKAVITVPAFFNDNQRAATQEAGELAGWEVVRIINEPTAAALVYEPNDEAREKLLVYDLGGGTFDVSIVQIEKGVVEVLSSHGDTHLGGDDFDELLLRFVADKFRQKNKVDLLEIPAARSRLLQAVEAAKCRLSDEAFTQIQEAFIAEVSGKTYHLDMTVDRSDYEKLIIELLQKTIGCVDNGLADAKLHAKDIDKVILVGGSSRTPLVNELLTAQLDQQPHLELDPDLCVAMGAAIQGALISGVDVGPILVDITPHTLGVRCYSERGGFSTNRFFSRVIPRNTPLPTTRSHIYRTLYPGQALVDIEVYQGEHDDIGMNDLIGSFTLEGLDETAEDRSDILVRFALDLNGTLKITVVERATSLEKQLTIDNAITRFRANDYGEAKERLAQVLGVGNTRFDEAHPVAAPVSARMHRSGRLIQKAQQLVDRAPPEDSAEIRDLTLRLQRACADSDTAEIDELADKLEDVLFYVEDAR